MIRKSLIVVSSIVGVLIVYFIAMPVPVEPIAWQSPPNPGYQGAFAANQRLKGIEKLPLGDTHGPEDVAVDRQGRIYAATHNGTIVRLQPDGSNAEVWVNTGGRPLGMEFNTAGDLIVADGYKGLLSIDPTGKITTLATEADGLPIRYTDDVDVAENGKIYFSDASTKFRAKEFGGAFKASLLDLLEHGKYGRLLMYDPDTSQTKTVLNGLSFANGVAVSHNQDFVLVVETGEYRIIRYWLSGPKRGQSEQFGPVFPSFPDNVTAGMNGCYWVALVSPRIKVLDILSERPFLRKIVQRLPDIVKPKVKRYGHIVALNAEGEVVEDLQDPEAEYPINTSITETDDYLYLGSLFTPMLGRLAKKKVGL